MARKRATKWSAQHHADGTPWMTSYQAALSQILYEEAYEALRDDPRRIEIIRQAMRDLAATFAPSGEGSGR